MPRGSEHMHFIYTPHWLHTGQIDTTFSLKEYLKWWTEITETNEGALIVLLQDSASLNSAPASVWQSNLFKHTGMMHFPAHGFFENIWA